MVGVSFTNAASDEVVTIDGVDYRIVKWTSNGSFSITGLSLDVEYLVVGGGGSGGGTTSTSRSGGGGGAGGLLTNVGGTTLTLSGSGNITVGSGGAAPGAAVGNDGGASEIDAGVTTVRAEGGGGGGRSFRTDSEGPGRAGGSGGGGGSSTSSTTPVVGGAGTAGQGNNGSNGVTISFVALGGGGGGANAAGGTAGASSNRGGAGGAGLANTITGTSVTYAGGGGGGSAGNGFFIGGGAGGGGTSGTAGTDGLGGGGGGATTSSTGTAIDAGKGGSGVVIIRYDTAQELVGSGDPIGSGDPVGSGSGDDVGSGSGSGSGDFPGEPDPLPTSSIFGQFSVRAEINLGIETSIDGKFGISGSVDVPVKFTEGIDNVAVRAIEEDFRVSTASAVAPVPPVGTQPQIVDKRWAAAPARRTVIVNLDGVPDDNGFLSTALQGDITWTRSAPSQWTVSLPVNSAEAQQFLQASRVGTYTPFHELQLWRGHQLLVWGPVTNLAVNGDTLELTGADVSWYLTRRYIGPVNSINLLPDQSPLGPGLQGWFTSVFRGWDNQFTSNSADINVTGARLPRNPAQWAIRIEDRNPIYNNDPDCNGFVSFPSAFQLMVIPRQKIPTSIEFSCLIEVERLISRNDESSAIGIGLFPSNARRGLKDLIDVAWAQVDDNFPVRRRQRLTVSMDIPANRDTFAVLMVRGPKGVSYLWDFNVAWDGGLISVNEPRSRIIRKVVDHVSGNPNTIFREAREHPFRPWGGPTSYGKSDAKIRVSAPGSSARVDRVYPFDQSTIGLSVLTELAETDEHSSWKMVTSDTQRTFTAIRLDRPRWECALRYTPAGGNINSFQWQYLGEQAANNIAVISSENSRKSSGEPTLVEVDDPRDRNWPVSLEDVSSAPDEILDENLERFAVDRWRAVSQPVALQVETSAIPLFTTQRIQPGHIVPVTIRHGELNITGLFRVYQVTLKADDSLSLTMTPYTSGNPISLV